MRVLLIKTSSMGDVIHTLPALTDALSAIPDLQVDWVVDRGFLVGTRPGQSSSDVVASRIQQARRLPKDTLQSHRPAQHAQAQRCGVQWVQKERKRKGCIVCCYP